MNSNAARSRKPERVSPRDFVYVSATISLALLETLVHVDQEDMAAGTYIAIPVDIPPAIRIKHIERNSLPKCWQKYDPSPPEPILPDGRLLKDRTP